MARKNLRWCGGFIRTDVPKRSGQRDATSKNAKPERETTAAACIWVGMDMSPSRFISVLLSFFTPRRRVVSPDPITRHNQSQHQQHDPDLMRNTRAARRDNCNGERSGSMRRPAAVYCYGCAGDRDGEIAAEKGAQSPPLGRFDETLRRHRFEEGALERLFFGDPAAVRLHQLRRLTANELGHHRTGANGVDGDPVLRSFERARAGQPDHAVL